MYDLIFVKGGAIMYPIVALSVYALAIIFYKAYQFTTDGVLNSRFVDSIMVHVKRGELSEALLLLGREKGPVARTMRVAIECIMNREITLKSREAEIARAGAAEVRAMESHIRGLEMASTTGPLLGLLGTVVGMIVAFATLAESGTRVDPSMLAGGIWQALICTVGGLVVAVPALACYYLIDSLIERVRATMRDVTIQILALEDMFVRNEKEQERREHALREERVRKMLEEQEKTGTTPRGAPKTATTLRLLSPNYTKM